MAASILTPPERLNVYEIVTEKIIAQLEQGVIPWHRPWSDVGVPVNLPSGRHYRGINVMLLSCSGYSSPYWMTYKQAQEMRGHVRRGEKSTLVVFWKWLEADADEPQTKEESIKRIPFLRYYSVFNLEQIDGIPASRIPTLKARNIEPIEAAQAIVDAMPNRPCIGHGGDKAFYRPATDSVQMPNREAFDSAEAYHSTLLHELTHATGHPSRLGRLDGNNSRLAPFGSADYSKEELVAEMGAAFLCAEAGIENATLTQSASYIGGWLEALKSDRRMVVLAAAQAQKAADFILHRKPHEAAQLSAA